MRNRTGRGFQLTTIQFGTVIDKGNVFPVNKANFDSKPIGRLKNLTFIEIKDNDDPKKVRSDKEADGWTFICDTQIFVSKFVNHVIVLGKKTFP